MDKAHPCQRSTPALLQGAVVSRQGGKLEPHQLGGLCQVADSLFQATGNLSNLLGSGLREGVCHNLADGGGVGQVS